MKRIITAIFVMALLVISLAGCTSDTVEVTVVLKNSTEYELETVGFQIPPTRGTYSPMHDLVTTENEVLKPNEEREAAAWLYESDLGKDGWAYILVKGDETKYGESNTVSLKKGTNRFEITYNGDKEFIVKAIEE